MGKNKKTIFGIIVIVFGLIVKPFDLKGEPDQYIHEDCRYDSLKIMAYSHPFTTENPITRYAFLWEAQFNNGEDKLTGNLIKDTIIVDTTIVDVFVRLLKQLPVAERTLYPSNWIVFDMNCYVPGSISLASNYDYGDNRMLVILYSTNHQDFAWFDSANIYFLDKHCYYSDEMRKLVVKWVNCIQ